MGVLFFPIFPSFPLLRKIGILFFLSIFSMGSISAPVLSGWSLYPRLNGPAEQARLYAKTWVTFTV